MIQDIFVALIVAAAVFYVIWKIIRFILDRNDSSCDCGRKDCPKRKIP